MKIAIMQPYFFPYLGYWQLIESVDKFVIFDDVNFIKKGWINRNRILLQGKDHLITLPIAKASQNKLINQLEIVESKNILSTIDLAYKKAPYYNSVMPLIENIMNYSKANLVDFLANQFNLISAYLGIKTEFVMSSSLNKDNDLKGQDKILDICKILGCTQYVNAIGGMELYKKDAFLENGIDLKFIKMDSIEYPQFKNDFISNLSIIDVMMFNSPEQIMKMLGCYELVEVNND